MIITQLHIKNKEVVKVLNAFLVSLLAFLVLSGVVLGAVWLNSEHPIILLSIVGIIFYLCIFATVAKIMC